MIQSLQQCHSNTERLISANSVRSVITVWLWLCMLPNHHSTFKDNLHKILGRHLGLPGEALVGPAITLGHALHDEVLPVEAGEADVVAGVDDLPITVPRQLILIRATHAAGQRHLSTNATSHLPGADHDFQGLYKHEKVHLVLEGMSEVIINRVPSVQCPFVDSCKLVMCFRALIAALINTLCSSQP